MTKRLFVAVALLLSFALPAQAARYYSDILLTTTSTPIPGATVKVLIRGSSTLAQIFSDNGVTPKSNPFLTDSVGRYEFWAADGPYTLQFITLSSSGSQIVTTKNITLGPSTVSPIPPPSTGGGTTGPQGPPGPPGPQGLPKQPQDEGVSLPARSFLNFVGAGVTATDDLANDRTNVTIPGGGAAPNAFTLFHPSAGADISPESPTDTFNLIGDFPIAVTGTAGTDTFAISLNPDVTVNSTNNILTTGFLQLGSLSPASATCIDNDSDRPYADLDCDGTQDGGEEYLDSVGSIISVNSNPVTDPDFTNNQDILFTNPAGPEVNASFARTATLGADPTLSANQCVFGTTGLICEGSTANTIEGLLTVADPTSTDKTWTLPNVSGTLLTSGDTDTVTNTILRNSGATSVIGRSANSTGDPADISASAVGSVLRLGSGPTLGFGAVDLADSDAVTGTLPSGNGGFVAHAIAGASHTLSGSTDGFALQATGASTFEMDWVRLRSHATDCTALTDGEANEVCIELDSEFLYSCQPTSGGCDTPGEWILTGDGGGGGSHALDGGTHTLAGSVDGYVLQATSATTFEMDWGRVRTAATDCTGLTDGEQGELCLELDADGGVNLYSCQPSSGACDTAGEWVATGDAGGGAGAPTDAEYVVAAAHGTLTQERVCTDTATVDCDAGTAAQMQFHVLEAGIEAIADLQDFQGSVPDAKVDDNITASNYVPLAGGTMTGNLTIDDEKELRLAEEDAGGSHYFAFQGPTALSTDVTCKIDSNGKIPDSCVGDGVDGGGGASASADVPYSPWYRPSDGLVAAASDEFDGGLDTTIYTLGNSPTVTASLDTLQLDLSATASIDRKVVWWAAPASGDWTFTTAVTADNNGTTAVPINGLFGIAALVSGTPASPTLIEMGIWQRNASADTAFGLYNATSYTASYANSLGAVTLDPQDLVGGPWMFLQYRFVDSSNNISFAMSKDGFSWFVIGTRTSLSANPSYVGVFGDQNSVNVAFGGRFAFVRTRNDVAGTTAPYPIGGDSLSIAAEAEYNPAWPPDECANCDEYETQLNLTTEWGNQGATTETWELGRAKVATPDPGSGVNLRALWKTTGLGGIDWVASIRVAGIYTDINQGFGIPVLETGTTGTPTKFWLCYAYNSGSQALTAVSGSFTSYTSSISGSATVALLGSSPTSDIYIRQRYVASTKDLTCEVSGNGTAWYTVQTNTLTSHPTANGEMGVSFEPTVGGGTAYVDFFRHRTDATGTTAPYPIGGTTPPVALYNETTEYNPDTHPATYYSAATDEFEGGFEQSWDCSNSFGTSSFTAELDTAILTPQAASGDNRRACWLPAPSAVDFIVVTRIHADTQADHNQMGLILLEDGTKASPTKLYTWGPLVSSGYKHALASSTSYTAGNSNVFVTTTGWPYNFAGPGCFAYRYTASTKDLQALAAGDCETFTIWGSATLTNHPQYVGLYTNPDNASTVGELRALWFRTFTDATHFAPPFPVSEP